jgi:hypothetical protein
MATQNALRKSSPVNGDREFTMNQYFFAGSLAWLLSSPAFVWLEGVMGAADRGVWRYPKAAAIAKPGGEKD